MADVDGNQHDLIIWTQDNYDLVMTTTDPDSDLSNGVTAAPANFSGGTLVETTPDSGPGVMNAQEMIRVRGKNAYQSHAKSVAGQLGGAVDFKMPAIGGGAELTATDSPSGGPWSHVLDAALGTPMTAGARVQVSVQDTSTSCTITAASNFADGMFFSVNWASVTGTYYHEVRQLLDITGTVLTWDRAVAAAPDTTEYMHPLMTWAPHSVVVDREVLYIKRRSTSAGNLDGAALDFAGCGVVGEWSTMGGQVAVPVWHITGQVNQWAVKTPEAPDLTGILVTDTAPLEKLSYFYLNGTAVEASNVSIATNISVAPKPAKSGREGRSGYTYFLNDGADVTWTVEVIWDSAYFTARNSETLYTCEYHAGENSVGTTAATDFNYWIHKSPAVQIVNVEEFVGEDGLMRMRLTLESKTSETSGQQSFWPYYVGCAGKAA